MVTNTRAIRDLRKSLSLDEGQRAVLVGSLLGDGSLLGNVGESRWNLNYRFQVAHCDEQRDYLWWKYEILRNWCTSPPHYQQQNRSWRFRTLSHPELTALRRIFYAPSGQKIVPADVESFLCNPLVLAVWFMDDGTKGPAQGYTLNTQSFSVEENRLLQRCLEAQLGLSVSIHRDKSWVRLYIRQGSSRRFGDLVRPYIVPAMAYKLFLTP